MSVALILTSILLLTPFKDGQDILRMLIVLKRRIVEHQTQWAIGNAYPESPDAGTFPSELSRTSAGAGITLARLRDVFIFLIFSIFHYARWANWPMSSVTPPSRLSRDVFSEITDYRIEFEQLLGGNVEDVHSSSPIPSSSSRQSLEKATQNDEDGPQTDGIEFRRPTRSKPPR